MPFKDKNKEREWRKNWRKKNKDIEYKRYVKYRNKRATFITSIKEQHGCLYCDETLGCVLTFHHLNPSEKEYDVSVLRAHSMEKIKTEIEKCIVVCFNCHRKIHAGLIKCDEKPITLNNS